MHTLTRFCRITLAALLGCFVLASHAKSSKEPAPPYAAAATCKTADSTPAAVVLVDLTEDNEQCAVAAAAEPRVYLVVRSSATPIERRGKLMWSVRTDADSLAVAAARLVPGKVLAVGPASDAQDVAFLTSLAIRNAAAEASDYESRDIAPSDIAPDESLPLVAKRFGWRLP